RYLRIVKSYGFDGLEVAPMTARTPDEAGARELADELRSAGLPVVCVRTGGPIAHPLAGSAARRDLELAIRFAAWMGAGLVNTTLMTPPRHPGGPGHRRIGELVSQGASRTATEEDFDHTAHHLQHFGRLAADLGVAIAVEVHQGSIVDNSASVLHLVDLIGLDNVGVNPDLGNILWHFAEPEETMEAAIVALAPPANY